MNYKTIQLDEIRIVDLIGEFFRNKKNSPFIQRFEDIYI